jgi:hypothetical protein
MLAGIAATPRQARRVAATAAPEISDIAMERA